MVGEVLISKLVVAFSTWLASKARLVDAMTVVGLFIVLEASANFRRNHLEHGVDASKPFTKLGSTPSQPKRRGKRSMTSSATDYRVLIKEGEREAQC